MKYLILDFCLYGFAVPSRLIPHSNWAIRGALKVQENCIFYMHFGHSQSVLHFSWTDGCITISFFVKVIAVFDAFTTFTNHTKPTVGRMSNYSIGKPNKFVGSRFCRFYFYKFRLPPFAVKSAGFVSVFRASKKL